jgi:HSP20 family protein
MKLMKWNPGFVNHHFTDMFDDILGKEMTGQGSMPAVNVIENGDNFRIEVAAPGFDKNDFKVTLDNDHLTIAVEKETEMTDEKDKYTRKEYHFGSFSRSFHLPDTIKGDKIDANYENGILKVNLPKREEAKEQPQRLIKIS